MSESLYRKWRPQQFADLKGQDTIRDTLFYGLTHGQMSQAYLFCGPRGTGKTTTARLVAKVVNCEAADTATKPCNTCSSCTTITQGTNLDIIEIDAASNRGIDEIRELKDAVRFAPTQARFKVIIIDEVHMLTREAFNALLKTLEEPPQQVMFVLATTESHKIPATILSRCQRYDFRLATAMVLHDHLLAVAQAEAIPLDASGAAFLARLGEGSFRDALSFLDQARSANLPEYTEASLENLFGYVPRALLASILAAVFRGQSREAHTAIDEALAAGRDVKALTTQLLALSQTVLESVALDDTTQLPESLIPLVPTLTLPESVQWIELLLDATNQMKQSPIARLPLDLAIAKWTALRNTQSPSPAPHASPPKEKPAAASGSSVKQASDKPASTAEAPPQAVRSETHPDTVAVPVAVEVTPSIDPETWQQFLNHLKSDSPSLVTSLSHAKVLGLEGDRLQLGVKYKMHAEKINQAKNRVRLESALESIIHTPFKLEAVVVKELIVEEDVADVADIFEFEEE